MKTLRSLAVLVLVAVLSAATFAGEDAKTVTVSGKLLCAKCSLKAADAKECQNVIVAEQDGKSVEFYLVKNAVSQEFGHVCKAEKSVVATGTVGEKDGKTWLTATKIDQPKS
jgi:Family of unknown function (DUF6370)